MDPGGCPFSGFVNSGLGVRVSSPAPRKPCILFFSVRIFQNAVWSLRRLDLRHLRAWSATLDAYGRESAKVPMVVRNMDDQRHLWTGVMISGTRDPFASPHRPALHVLECPRIAKSVAKSLHVHGQSWKRWRERGAIMKNLDTGGFRWPGVPWI